MALPGTPPCSHLAEALPTEPFSLCALPKEPIPTRDRQEFPRSLQGCSHLSRMGFSCSSSGLALPRMRFLASAYSASRCASDLTGKAGRLAEWGLLSTPLVVGRLRMRIWGGGPAGRLSSWITIGTLGGDLDFLLLGRKIWGWRLFSQGFSAW